MKIGIIGYGVIGSSLAQKIRRDKNLKLEFICENNREKQELIKRKKFPLCLPEELLKRSKTVDLVVEAASFEAVHEYAPDVLRNTNMLLLSVSSLFYYKELKERLENISTKSGTILYIPHGAILGLDGIFDGKNVWRSVRITTIKHPSTLIRYPEKKKLIGKEILEGKTEEICKIFPLNVNIHAAIALAVGPEKCHSKVIAKNVSKNIHIIEGEGTTSFRIEIESERAGGVTSSYVPESIFMSIKRLSQHSGIIIT